MQRGEGSPRRLTIKDRVLIGGMGLGLAMGAGAVADMRNPLSEIDSAKKAKLVQFPVDTAAKERASAVVSSFQQQIDQAVATGNPSALIALATSEQLAAVQKAKSDLQVVAEQQRAQNEALDRADTEIPGRLLVDTALASVGIALFAGSVQRLRFSRAIARKVAANSQS